MSQYPQIVLTSGPVTWGGETFYIKAGTGRRH